MSRCPSCEQLQQLLADQLNEALRQTLETHVEGCADCQETLARLSDEGEEVDPEMLLGSSPAPAAVSDLDFMRRLEENPPRAGAAASALMEGAEPSPIAFPGPPTEKGPLGQLDGFAIRKTLGAGRFGIVYQAYDELDRLVAIKVLKPELAASAVERARFEREARKAAAVKHEHIVTIHQVGHTLGFPLPYLIMEYIDGESLRDRLDRQGVMEAKEAARIVRQVALALTAAHARGLVHRDIKPSNILLEAGSERAKLTDFGLARVTEAVGVSTSQSGRIVGTPGYMSPEQIVSPGQVDGRSDVYSLGVVLYELLTGERPFRGVPHLLLQQVVHDEPRPPRKLSDNIPRDLETVCLKAMAKAPARRYITVRELAEDLGRFLAGEPIKARPVGSAERLWRWCRRNPALATMGTGVALLLVSVAVVSTLAAWRLGEAHKLTIQAEREKSEKLWQSYLDQVRAHRSSHEVGQRFDSLKKLREAAVIVRSLDYNEDLLAKNLLKLRNEAIACMALPDLRDLRTWPGNKERVANAAFDAGLRRYATSDSLGNIVVRQVADDSEILRIPSLRIPSTKTHRELRFSPDGRFLATKYLLGKGGRIVLWDLSSNKRIREVPARVAGGECLDFSPDSRRLAVGGPEETIDLYDCVLGKELKSLGRDLMPENIAFDPSGRKLAACSASVVQILDVDTSDILATLSQPVGKGGSPWSLAWSPDGRLLAVGSFDAKVCIWDMLRLQQSMVLEGHQGGVFGLAFNHAGTLLLSCSDDGTSRLWDARKAKHLLTIPGRLDKFSSDDRQLASEQRGQTSIWEIANGRELTTLHCVATTLDFSPRQGLLATAGHDGVRLWDRFSAREVADLRLDHCETAAFHPKGQSLVTYGKASSLRLWPVCDGPQGHPGGLQIGPPQVLGTTLTHTWKRACWSRDGRWLGVADYRNDTAFLLNPDRPGDRLVLGSFPELATITLSPDGRWAATGARDLSQVRIWRLPDRTPVRDLPGYSHAAFSPDGQWLVTGGDVDYRFWRIGTWEPDLLLSRDQRLRITAPLAFSADGRMLALSRSPQGIQLLDPATGREIATLSAPGPSHNSWLCFSPDGTQLGVANGQEGVHLWDLRAIRQQLADLGLDWSLPPYLPAKDVDKTKPAHAQVLQEPKESWRSYWLVRGRAHQAFRQPSEAVLDFTEALRVLPPEAPPEQRAELLRLRALNFTRARAHEAALVDLRQAVELVPDSATACHDLARLYVTGPQRLRDPHEALPLARHAADLEPNERLYQNTLGVVYYRLALYAQAIETLQRSLRERKGETAAFDQFVLAMCHARRGETAEAKSCYDRAIQWMQAWQGKLPLQATKELDAFYAEAQELLRSKGFPILNIVPKISAAAAGAQLPAFAGHTGPISSVALSADGQRVLTGSADQTAVLWDAQTHSKLRTFTGHTDIVSSVVLSGDGQRVLTGSHDFTAILWDATSGVKLRTFRGHTRDVVSAALSGDGQRVLTGSWDQSAILWDAQSGAKLRTFAGHSAVVNSVALSSDGQRVLVGLQDHTAILWDAQSGAKLQTFTGHTAPVTSVCMSEDGQRVLTGSADRTAILWDATGGAKLRTFAGHSQEVLSVVLSRDGQRVLTGSQDKTAVLWDAQSGDKLRTFAGHTDEVRSVALSRDGRRVLTGSLDHTAILWDAQSGAQLRNEIGGF